jgi:hypothetical protein
MQLIGETIIGNRFRFGCIIFFSTVILRHNDDDSAFKGNEHKTSIALTCVVALTASEPTEGEVR